MHYRDDSPSTRRAPPPLRKRRGVSDPSATTSGTERLARERWARLRAEAVAERRLRELRLQQQRIDLLEAIVMAANKATGINEAFEFTMRDICHYMRWPLGHAFVVDGDAPDGGPRLRPSGAWYCAEAARFAAFRAATDARCDSGSEGLPGRVLASGQPAWITDLGKDTDFPRAASADAVGLRAAFAFPVLTGNQVAAVLEFFVDCPAEPDDALLRVMTRIGMLLGSVVERQRANERLVHEALHDPLTTLPNRALFLKRLQLVLEHSKRQPDYRFAVLFLDLDRFKSVNDNLGHSYGDELIAEAGRRLVACLRRDDVLVRGPAPTGKSIVARLGGDEFTIILEDIRYASDAMRVAQRIQWSLAEPFVLANQKICTSASIGIALSATGYENVHDILRDADAAMYRAKAGGRARSEVCNQTMSEQASATLRLETELYQAVDGHQLRVLYQPIVSLGDTTIRGFEALLRWEHPTRGLMHPAEFLPMAEQTGLIHAIGDWVLEQACRQARQWQLAFPADPPLTMSVNVSASQLGSTDFVDRLRCVLNDTGMPPDSVILELTESVAMVDAERTKKVLLELKSTGMQISLDDFGTGYSSLSYLRQLPIDTLKIDRSFITGLDVNEGNRYVLETITKLAHTLGMKVVAEGAETTEELDYLRHLDCDFAQGYYFFKPLDQAAAAAALRAQAEEAGEAARPAGDPLLPCHHA